jgi:hypothetical protein
VFEDMVDEVPHRMVTVRVSVLFVAVDRIAPVTRYSLFGCSSFAETAHEAREVSVVGWETAVPAAVIMREMDIVTSQPLSGLRWVSECVRSTLRCTVSDALRAASRAASWVIPDWRICSYIRDSD